MRRESGGRVARDAAWLIAYSKAVEISTTKSSLTPCILDNNPEQLELLAGLVTEMGYEPVPTADPEEALKMVRYGCCRLVFADVQMPESNGYEFLDRALRTDPGVHVIVMTANYTLDSAPEAIRGATDFLPEPIDRIRLKRTLDDVAALRKLHIHRVLEMCQGNCLRAAQILGIGRTSLYRYLKRDGQKADSRGRSAGGAV